MYALLVRQVEGEIWHISTILQLSYDADLRQFSALKLFALTNNIAA